MSGDEAESHAKVREDLMSARRVIEDSITAHEDGLSPIVVMYASTPLGISIVTVGGAEAAIGAAEIIKTHTTVNMIRHFDRAEAQS